MSENSNSIFSNKLKNKLKFIREEQLQKELKEIEQELGDDIEWLKAKMETALS